MGIPLGVLATVILASVAAQAGDELCHRKADSDLSQQETAAILDGNTIHMADVDNRIRDKLLDYETHLYSSRLTELNSIIDKRLWNREAEKHGLSPEEYYAGLINSRPVKTSEIEAVYEDIKSHLRGISVEDAKEQVQRDLTEIRRRQVYEETIQQLRADAKISILLVPPVEPVVSVSLNGREPSLGPPTAKVTIVEFSDFQCPYCKKIQQSLATVAASNPKEVRLIFKNLPLPSHRAAQVAAEGGFCAGQQDRFWQYKDRVFAMAPNLEPEGILDVGRSVVPDAAAFNNCMIAGATESHIRADIAEADRLGIQGTPTLVINGKVLRGMVTAEAIQRVVLNERSLTTDSRSGTGCQSAPITCNK